jgi:hypothetical protein
VLCSNSADIRLLLLCRRVATRANPLSIIPTAPLRAAAGSMAQASKHHFPSGFVSLHRPTSHKCRQPDDATHDEHHPYLVPLLLLPPNLSSHPGAYSPFGANTRSDSLALHSTPSTSDTTTDFFPGLFTADDKWRVVFSFVLFPFMVMPLEAVVQSIGPFGLLCSRNLARPRPTFARVGCNVYAWALTTLMVVVALRS